MYIMSEQIWTKTIDSKNGGVMSSIHGLFDYRDLIRVMVKRDFKVIYSQTVLGPLWFIFQPLLMTVVVFVVFGKLAKMPTNGISPIIFYSFSIPLWNLFSEVFVKSSTIFRDNQGLFSKVYFPRLVIPISIVISGFVRFIIQFVVLIVLLTLSDLNSISMSSFNVVIAVISTFIIILNAFSLGLIFSSFTSKYRDIAILVPVLAQVLMYLSPVIYPISLIPEKFVSLILLNPIAIWIENFRNSFLKPENINFSGLSLSIGVSTFLALLGIFLYSSAEKKAMDYA